jgi:hypothetical protein
MAALKPFADRGDISLLNDNTECAMMTVNEAVAFLRRICVRDFEVRDPISVVFSQSLQFVEGCQLGRQHDLGSDSSIVIHPIEWGLKAGSTTHWHMVILYTHLGHQYFYDPNGGLRNPVKLLPWVQEILGLPVSKVTCAPRTLAGPQVKEAAEGAYKRGTPTGYCMSWLCASVHYLFLMRQCLMPEELIHALNPIGHRSFIMGYTAFIIQTLGRLKDCPMETSTASYHACVTEPLTANTKLRSRSASPVPEGKRRRAASPGRGRGRFPSPRRGRGRSPSPHGGRGRSPSPRRGRDRSP